VQSSVRNRSGSSMGSGHSDSLLRRSPVAMYGFLGAVLWRTWDRPASRYGLSSVSSASPWSPRHSRHRGMRVSERSRENTRVKPLQRLWSPPSREIQLQNGGDETPGRSSFPRLFARLFRDFSRDRCEIGRRSSNHDQPNMATRTDSKLCERRNAAPCRHTSPAPCQQSVENPVNRVSSPSDTGRASE